jgi:single-stranded-DNA-specific exonuclease
MNSQAKKWEILEKRKATNEKEIVKALLANRGIKTEKEKKEFFKPTDPTGISLKSLGIRESEVNKAVNRIKKAKKSGEHVIIYGDYDADGITGTATLWEAIHNLGIFVLPHIPERFSEGYGLNLETVIKLKKKDPEIGLIITVDHGIIAGNKIGEIKKMGIDMIITDHHQAGKTKPQPLALIYTTKIGGSAIAWFFAREITKKILGPESRFRIGERLQLAAIGTVADQIPLSGPNRSIVKFGLEELNKTKRPGLLSLFKEARIEKAGTYEIGYMIAPRINSMGRLKHGLESLRLLCTRDALRAKDLALTLAGTNSERQRIVDEVILHARKSFKIAEKQSVITLAHESYHEGVIGLAAAKLAEEFYRPAIVFSKKESISKASARSIPGFNIIEAIRSLENLYLEGGGHPMAAGFSIETKNIKIFSDRINKYAAKLLTDELLQKKLKIDAEIDFDQITDRLMETLKQFDPTGLGNPSPSFFSKSAKVVNVKAVGREAKHLKLALKQNEVVFDSIFFGGGENYSELTPGKIVDIAYYVEENIWNGNKNIQLKIRDIR